jgi:DNA-damage-inducible protein J
VLQSHQHLLLQRRGYVRIEFFRADSLLFGLQSDATNKGETLVSSITVVRALIDERIKEEASAVLAAAGLTVSDAFRIMLTRVAHDKALPFEPLVPNPLTNAAINEARRGGLQ